MDGDIELKEIEERLKEKFRIKRSKEFDEEIESVLDDVAENCELKNLERINECKASVRILSRHMDELIQNGAIVNVRLPDNTNVLNSDIEEKFIEAMRTKESVAALRTLSQIYQIENMTNSSEAQTLEITHKD